MFDISTEQIIKTKAPKHALAFKVIMIIADILAITTIPAIYTMGFLLFAVLVVFTILLYKYYDAEYEYSLVDNEMTIDKIMARSLRRRCGVYNIHKASVITNAGTQDALRMEYKKLRTFTYQSNQKDALLLQIFTLDGHNEMVKLIIEPDEKMLQAIKASADKNAYKVEESFEKKIKEKCTI